MNLTKQERIKSNLKWYPECSVEILSFIYDMTHHYDENNKYESKCREEVIAGMFACGYCFYFAKMLENAFEGKAMWLYKRTHIVFMAPNKICYDSRGIYDDFGEDELYPIEALSKTPLDGFKHVGNFVRDIAAGDCTDTITWLLYENGTLSICGKGVLPNYPKGQEPWHKYNHLIKNIEIAEIITSSKKPSSSLSRMSLAGQ